MAPEMPRIAIGGVEHFEVAAHVLGLALLLVEALGGVHVPAELGDHVGHGLVEAGGFADAAAAAVRGRLPPSSSLPRMKSFMV